MENKQAELQKTISELKLQLVDIQEKDAYNDNLNVEVKQEGLSLSGMGSRKIFDTAELFHADRAIDNIAFQEYHESKEKSSRSDIWPR